jgi:hypothetical protein
MQANSTSKSFTSRFPIVVVETNDNRLKFSSPPDQDFKAFSHNDAQMLQNEGLVAIWKNTTMKFDFNGKYITCHKTSGVHF